MDDLKDIGAAILIFVVIVSIAVLVVWGIVTAIEYGQCKNLTSYDSPHEYRHGLFTGCLVQTEQGYWVDSSNPVFLEIEGE